MTEHKQLVVPFAAKSTSETGTFEGRLSVYNNVDLGGDIVEPGAFKEFHLTPDGCIRILDGHNMRFPVGKGKLRDLSDGLHLKGMLDMNIERARELHSLIKSGVVSGLSVGFDILPGGQKMGDDGIRRITRAKLWEASLTAFPMNPEAAITSVKDLPASIGDLETKLRAIGFSKRKARAVALHAWPILRGPELAVDAKELIELFDNIS